MATIRDSSHSSRRPSSAASFQLRCLDSRRLESIYPFREWSQLYENPDTSLAPLELSFRDYVLAEIALRDSDLYRRSQDYWWSRLPTLPPAPELPLAKNPRSVTQPRFVRRSARLEPETWLRLKNRAAQTGPDTLRGLVGCLCRGLESVEQEPSIYPQSNALPSSSSASPGEQYCGRLHLGDPCWRWTTRHSPRLKPGLDACRSSSGTIWTTVMSVGCKCFGNWQGGKGECQGRRCLSCSPASSLREHRLGSHDQWRGWGMSST